MTQPSKMHNTYSSLDQLQQMPSSSIDYKQLTVISSNLRRFFICSGLLYFLIAIICIGLDICITITSYSQWYLGFSTSGFLISAGISTLIIACQPTYSFIYFLWTHISGIALFSLTLSAAIVNLALSRRCYKTVFHTECDTELAFALKTILVIIFIISLLHNIMNLIIVRKATALRAKILSTQSYNVS